MSRFAADGLVAKPMPHYSMGLAGRASKQRNVDGGRFGVVVDLGVCLGAHLHL